MFNLKFHSLVYILWFPLWFLALTIFHFLIMDLHGYVVIFFWICQPVFLFLGRQQILEGIKKPQVIMVLVSLLFTIGMVELLIRIVNTPFLNVFRESNQVLNQDLWRFQRSHYIGFEANPGHAAFSGDVINSRSFRGPEIVLPKPEGVFRIVALGGSTTWGTGVDFWEDAYPHQLQRVLQEEYGYDNVEVINAGQASYNSFETLMSFEFRVLDLDPDMIILYQNTNDVHARLVPPELYRGDNSGRRIPWNFEAQQETQNPILRVPGHVLRLVLVITGLIEIPSPDLDTYISHDCSSARADEACLGMTPMEALLANPPIYYQRNVENIVGIARQQGVEVVFMTWAHTPLFDDYAARADYEFAFAEHNDVMRTIAAENDVALFDLVPVMPTDLLYWSDGRHMSAEGNRLRAELLADYLVNENLLPE